MKKISNSILGLGLCALGVVSLTGCIEEYVPTQVATVDQVQQSASALEATMMSMPAYFNTVDPDNGHYRFGYGAIMHVRDLQTGDLAHKQSDYDHFTAWEILRNIGDGYAVTQYLWNYHNQFLLTANILIGSVDEENATSTALGYVGTGYAYRALLYLDMARMYEFLPNDVFDGVNSSGNNVTNYTVPIVTDETTEEASRNNPRATRTQMAAFIESDLNKAEKYIVNLTDTKGKVLPNLACVYGLKARLYMWIEDYENARIYARKAIDESGLSPMTEEQCLNTTTGFNVADPWMWASQQNSNSNSVRTGLVNWTSWMSNETSWGYTHSGGPYPMIDHKMYDRISNTDFRKLMWKAPEGSALAGKERYISREFYEEIPDYSSLKFRPGGGNTSDYQTGAATAIPIMRVEEMYFIEAEAAAHSDAAAGKALIEDFMKTYRDKNYTCSATSVDDVVEEIVFQKRVELWGEGQSFFDIKRLNYSVTRGYIGTNFMDLARFNTNGRPAWMNWVIVRTEEQQNSALIGWNNPDPTGSYIPWTE